MAADMRQKWEAKLPSILTLAERLKTLFPGTFDFSFDVTLYADGGARVRLHDLNDRFYRKICALDERVGPDRSDEEIDDNGYRHRILSISGVTVDVDEGR